MCGRYGRRGDKQKIAEAFERGDLDALYLETSPSYNIAPATMQPVIVADRDTHERQLRIIRWGLIPAWTKSLKDFELTTINAKAEDVASKPPWRNSFQYRRCLVPDDLFYEWQKLDAKTKQPYAFGLRDDRMFAFAGIWSSWRSEDRTVAFDIYSIITTEPNELTSAVTTECRSF